MPLPLDRFVMLVQKFQKFLNVDRPLLYKYGDGVVVEQGAGRAAAAAANSDYALAARDVSEAAALQKRDPADTIDPRLSRLPSGPMPTPPPRKPTTPGQDRDRTNSRVIAGRAVAAANSDYVLAAQQVSDAARWASNTAVVSSPQSARTPAPAPAPAEQFSRFVTKRRSNPQATAVVE